MTKEDLNRQFGDPGRQKPITPPDLLAAAHLIRDHCNDIKICMKCIFHDDKTNCYAFFKIGPFLWNLSGAEHKTADLIDKQYFQGRGLYIDTDSSDTK